MKSSMPWPTFTLLAISLALTIISLLSPAFLQMNNNNHNNFEEYQQPVATETEYSLNNESSNTNSLLLQPIEIEKMAYKISNSGNNQKLQNSRYQKQDDTPEDKPITSSVSPEQNQYFHNQLEDKATAPKLEIIELKASSVIINSDQIIDKSKAVSDIRHMQKLEENTSDDKLYNDHSPLRKTIEVSSSKSIQSENTTDKQEVPPIKQMSLKASRKFNSNQNHKKVETDENIIFLSASMALVFGAISARRLVKKRRFLAGFFENDDSVEDELAYDMATTVSSDVGYYGSFASPWIGDMEKFDV